MCLYADANLPASVLSPHRQRAEVLGPRSEAEAHGTVEAEQGCEVTTSGEMLSAARSKQDATGAPIDGCLVESPRDTRVYRCTYEGQVPGNAGRVAVWEAADADAGGPRPALDFQPR